MNPNSEHIDDGTSVKVDPVADFKTWLTGPPRRRKSDVFGFVVAAGLLCTPVVIAPDWIDESAIVPTFLGTFGTVTAEVLPVTAVKTARVLRVAGLPLLTAALGWTFATPWVSATS